MTSSTMIEPGKSGRGRTITLIAVALVAAISVPFALGVLGGYSDKAGRDYPVALAVAISAILLAIAGFAVNAIYRSRHRPGGQGEVAAASRRRDFWLILGGLFGVGMVVGASIAAGEMRSDGGSWFSGPLDPTLAMAVAVVTTLALIVGTLIFYRRIDEFERADNIYASAVAANVVTIVYPVWYLLGRGGWTSEPRHEVIFLLLLAVMMIAYGWRKLR